ncbi:hypothetical protein EFR94_09595 [Levilactobacillus brevis]|uniref:hypothetical protein n=1 Tax=Levilactobacillus brevis TaxID=1580 RepID=UPI0021A6C46E|nr:hypothetical protein [Levilactobacillus brevis]MCT3567638.1 hypothetical protein [Levilactobacillus brevis]
MTDDAISKLIIGLPKYAKIDVVQVASAIADAKESIKGYQIKDGSVDRAIRLYACHLLFVRILKHKERFQTVKAEDGTYTKFDKTMDDDAWAEFKTLLKEQGYGQYGIKFL